ncbi:MAG: holo-ACP synthase [Candidatus Eisenbacteria bacterium]|nr:holo-ACP synthase [Candidatus Eisenbacteria bacterium]
MFKGIGVDLVEIERFKHLQDKEEFLGQILTEKEILDIRGSDRQDFLQAKLFAVKEAVLKALGCGLQLGTHWHDIEISRDLKVTLSGAFERAARAKSVKKIHVSESHSEDYAAALVIIE